MRYAPQYRRSPINVGYGDAQIFKSTENDLSGVGAGLYANSDGNKRRVKRRRAKNKIDDLDYSYEGLLPAQSRDLLASVQELKQAAMDPNMVKRDDYDQVIDAMAEKLTVDFEQHASLAREYQKRRNQVRGKDPYNFDQEGLSRFNQMQDPGYGLSENSMLRGSDLQKQMLADIEGVVELYEADYDDYIPSYTNTNSEATGYEKDGDKLTTTVRELTPDQKEEAIQKFNKHLEAGLNTLNGTAAVPDRKSETMVKDVIMDMEEEDPTSLAEAGQDPEARKAAIKAYGREWYMRKVKAKSDVGKDTKFIDGEPKESKQFGNYSYEEIQEATKFKEAVNYFQEQFQKTGDTSALDQYLRPYGMAAVNVDPNNKTFDLTAIQNISKKGERVAKSDLLAERIDVNNAEMIYKAVAGNVKDLDIEAINLAPFKDPNSGTKETKDYLSIKSAVTKLFSLDENSDDNDELAKSLGVKTESNFYNKYVIIEDENGTTHKFNLSNKEEAEKGYEKIVEIVAKKNNVSRFVDQKGDNKNGGEKNPKSKNNSSTKEDLDIQEGMTKENREYYLKHKNDTLLVDENEVTIRQLVLDGNTIEEIKRALGE